MDKEQQRLAEELLFSGEKLPSFVKRLFHGKFDPQLIAPYPHEGAERQALPLLDELERFVNESLDPVDIDRKERIPASVISKLGKMGLLGMTLPKEYGGLGLSQVAYCKAIEMIASRCGATAVFINAHQSIGLKGIFLFGTEEQKKKWLPSLASGRYLAAFALTEPNAGSDAAGIETRAEYDSRKGVWRIKGQKQWITNGSIAHLLTVMAKTRCDDGKERVTAFLVTPDLRGFNVTRPALEKVGIRGTRTTNFELLDVEVPDSSRLGAQGAGLKVCLTALDYGRTTFGAMCTGAAKFAVAQAVEHAKRRIQFNQPLAAFALVKEKIARMSALAYAMEASTYLTAALIDGGIEDMMLEAAILKVFASDSLWEILYETMQIYGGRSFFCDQPFERMMRDARLNMIGEGSNEVLRVFIAGVGLRSVGMELKSAVDAGGVHTFWKMGLLLLGRLSSNRFTPFSRHLKGECRQLAAATSQLGRILPRLVARHREAIIYKQQLLNRVTECLIALYTITAVLSRASKAHGSELAIAKHYCRLAFARFQRNSSLLLEECGDGSCEELSDLITGREDHG